MLNNWCHQMDATRPTTMAHEFMLEIDRPLIGITDMAAVLFLTGTWIFFDMGEMAFVLYAAVCFPTGRPGGLCHFS